MFVIVVFITGLKVMKLFKNKPIVVNQSFKNWTFFYVAKQFY